MIDQNQPETSQSPAGLLKKIDLECEKVIKDEPGELRAIRTGSLENQAGSYGQYFSTMDIAAGMLRDYAGYTMYPLVRMARDPQVPVEHLRRMIEEFDPPYTNYLGYSGLTTLSRFATAVRSIASEASKDELAELFGALNRYANRVNAWCHHYFPWGLGDQFRYEGDVEEVPAVPASETLPTAAQADILLRWEPMGIEVRAKLAHDSNPELCADFQAALPFTALQDHAVVTGKSMYAWAPMMSTAPVRVKEQINLAPLGRLRFSQGTGQKLVLQYGPTTETLLAPVLGQVVGEDIPLLDAVGDAVWASTFHDKSLIWITVRAL